MKRRDGGLHKCHRDSNGTTHKAFIRPYWGMMVVNTPFVRPAISWGFRLALGGGVPLDFHDTVDGSEILLTTWDGAKTM